MNQMKHKINEQTDFSYSSNITFIKAHAKCHSCNNLSGEKKGKLETGKVNETEKQNICQQTAKNDGRILYLSSQIKNTNAFKNP